LREVRRDLCLIFHKWKYLSPKHKVCKNCGKCQYFLVTPLDSGFITVSFDDLMLDLRAYEQGLKKNGKNEETTLSYLNSLEVE